MRFFWKRKPELPVEPGMTFERTYGVAFRERAQVIKIDDKLFGTPHVTFQKTYRTGDWEEAGGTFILSLGAFRETYRPLPELAPEPVEATPPQVVPALRAGGGADDTIGDAGGAVVLDFQQARKIWKKRHTGTANIATAHVPG